MAYKGGMSCAVVGVGGGDAMHTVQYIDTHPQEKHFPNNESFEAWSPHSLAYYYPPGTNSLFPPTNQPRHTLLGLTISRVAFKFLI